VNTWDENYRSVYEEGKNRVHPFVVPKLMNNAAASHVSMEWNLKGPSFSWRRPAPRRTTRWGWRSS
jgi:nodulation protein E